MHSLGSKVTHIVRNDILNFLDTEVKDVLKKNMEIKKMDVRYGIKVTKVDKMQNGRLIVHLSDGN